MALKIRLRRMGRRNAPTYRIVVAESSMPRDGRIVESLGHYNPRSTPKTLSVDRTRSLYWIERGAVPTETAKALLKKAGVFRPEEEANLIAAAAANLAASAKKAGSKVKATAAKVAEVVQEAASEVRETAGGVIGTVVEAAGDAVEAVRERVSGGDTEEVAVAADEAEAPAKPE